MQSINGNSFLSFLENTKTFEMMKFMINIIINNTENNELKSKLRKIVNNEELEIENILNTLKDLSESSSTIKKLYQRLEKNPLNFKTKSKFSGKPSKSYVACIFSNK